MNVFVLCTGRCGSTTFSKACGHITNYSVAHESRSHLICDDRLSYPPDHIEVDNRLSWFLGRLDEAYGHDAFYVHLQRDEMRTSKSFLKRYGNGIIKAYASNIIMGGSHEPIQVCRDYYLTVNANIRMFLKHKPNSMNFDLGHAKADFQRFWQLIDAEGDLSAALSEWDCKYNASK